MKGNLSISKWVRQLQTEIEQTLKTFINRLSNQMKGKCLFEITQGGIMIQCNVISWQGYTVVGYWGGMPPVAAHLWWRVETMRGLTGLLVRILSISSMMVLVSLGRSFNRNSVLTLVNLSFAVDTCKLLKSVHSCSVDELKTTTHWLVLFLRLQARTSWVREVPSLSAICKTIMLC